MTIPVAAFYLSEEPGKKIIASCRSCFDEDPEQALRLWPDITNETLIVQAQCGRHSPSLRDWQMRLRQAGEPV